MPRRRDSIGKALRRALGEEVVLPKIEPRKSGVSHLMNRRRLLVFHAVFNEPGVHLRKLQRTLDIPLQSLRWHVSALRSARLLDGISLGKKVILFSPISAERDDVVLESLNHDERFAPLLDALREKGEVSVRELVKRTDSYQQLVSARLKALRSLGIVTPQGKGTGVRYKLTQSAERHRSTRDSGEGKEVLITLLADEGLAPKITRQSGGTMTVNVETAEGELSLEFRL